MPKRTLSSSSSCSDSSSEPSRKRRRSVSPSDAKTVNVYIVDAKLDAETIAELVSLVEESRINKQDLEICPRVEDADVIVTGVRMRKRLERHLEWNLAVRRTTSDAGAPLIFPQKQKAIVTPQWLRDSIKEKRLLPCGGYAALGELQDETEKHCPDGICSNVEDCKHTKSTSSPKKLITDVSPPQPLENSQISHRHRYACMRHSPMVCPNQDLVNEFAVLYRHRELEGWEIRVLSYERTIAVLKGLPWCSMLRSSRIINITSWTAYPHKITEENLDDVGELPFIGEKALFKIKEYLRTGHISEAQTIRSDERYQALCAFTSIYGIGHNTARKLYSMSLRTLEHLDAYYDVKSDTESSTAEKLLPVPRDSKLNLPLLTIQVGLALRRDLIQKIPRTEVEEMRDVVMRELGEIKVGCVSTITGGYRRGKSESNDVDIVISHEDLKSGSDEVKGLCSRLVKRLYDQGLVTHVMHLSSFREHNAIRTPHWDSLEKALTVFVLPDDGKQRRVHRRLDLIFAAPEVYWTAVVGWTGSKMFERDLRSWAKQEKGMKFDSSGISRRHDSKLYFPKSEPEVFSLLGLEWIDPTLRNADA
ncbi:hypothetical protein VNI00_011615 [Paramarasmius palmivorus]|uniref:BRCT domain-containing protein n=1 Tax=Paramarasmius palmivorus TaxID=297713 RepID=A0AAW0CE01_9AGAR